MKLDFSVARFTLPALLMLAGCGDIDRQKGVPRAEQHPVTLNLAGYTRTDPYHYLADRQHPDTEKYIVAERRYFTETTKTWNALQQEYLDLVNPLLPDETRSPLVRSGNYWYQRVVHRGSQYPVYQRRTSLDGDAESLLDLNRHDRGSGYLVTGAFETRENLIAYTIDDDGDEIYHLYVHDFERDVLLAELEGTGPSVAWHPDNRSLLYVDAGMHRVSRLDLVTGLSSTIHMETDPAYHITLRSSRSGNAAVLDSRSHQGNEITVLGEDGESILAARQAGTIYRMLDTATGMVVLTNARSAGFELALIEAGQVDDASWHFLDLPIQGVIRDFEIVSTGVIAIRVTEGLTEVVYRVTSEGEVEEIFTTDTGEVRLLSAEPGTVRFAVTDLVTPETVYEQSSGELHPARGEEETPRETYQVTRRWVEQGDVSIPVTLARKIDGHNQPAPLLLSVYGAYGISASRRFNPALVPYLEQGFIVGIVHARGGGEFGSAWHTAAMADSKRLTFDDFIGVTRELVRQDDIDHRYIFARGGSAGGTVLGVAANEAPDLYRGLILDSPFMDLVTTLSSDQGWMSEGDRLEWGDPSVPVLYRALAGYSPYDNVSAQAYPAILARIDLADARVGYHEGLKWIARLRAEATGDSLRLVDITDQTGHLGPSDQYELRRRESLEYAFVMSLLSQ